MTWNFVRIRAVAAVLSASAYLASLNAPALAQDANAGAQTIPNTGQQITPLAPPNAQFRRLNPGLPDNPAWLAGQAVTTAGSPDKKTLLVLTSGYNRVAYSSGPNAGLENYADSNEYVFVFDISNHIPVQKQAIQLANTYNGIAVDPNGTAFYVGGGVSDNVHIFHLLKGIWAEEVGSPVALGHTAGLGIGVAPAAAGVAVAQDGTKLVVTNYYNDSISVLTQTQGLWSKTAELDLRPGVINPAQVGVPGGEYPLWVTIKGNATAYVSSIRDREIDVVDISGTTPSVTTRIPVTGQPLKMTLNAAQTTLYVAEDQTDSVGVIDTNSNQLIAEAPASAPAGLLPGERAALTGNNTNSVTISPDQKWLYVTNGNTNNIAVLSVSALEGKNPVVGLIPTGWYPNSVTFSGDGKTVYVANGKTPTGANPAYCHGGILPTLPASACNASNQYDLQLIKAGLQSFQTPTIAQLTTLTEQVAKNNGYRSSESPATASMMKFLRQHIQHVIYIIKENRTYDQVLGDLSIGEGDPGLTEFPASVTPNLHNLAQNFVTLDHFFDTSEVSMDGWPWSTSARAPDVVERQVTVEYGGRGLSYDSEGYVRNVNVSYPTVAERTLSNPAMPNDPNLLAGTTDTAAPDGPGNQLNTGYLWDQALRAGLSVRDYGFFVQNVGSAFINPNPPTTVVAYSTGVSLHPFTDPYYRGFDMNMPDFYLEQEWLREFNANYKTGGLPALTLLRLPHNHTGSFGTALAGVNTPQLQVADNDYAVGLVVETIANSIYAGNTLVFVIEDDAQNGGDHIDAHRSTAFIVGPYVKQHALVSTPYNTVNFVRTMEEVLGLQPLNLNDSIAQPMADVFDIHETTWSYTAAPSALLYSTQLPLPTPVAGLKIPKQKHDAAYWARVTKGLDFSKEDLLDGATYNRILWKGIMGDKPYPAPQQKPAVQSRGDDE